MSITKDTIKETIKTIMAEEGDYKAFFKKALEKAGKDIPSMSDEEKKEFFNKIDAAWDGKGEKNEGNAFGAAVTKAKEKGEDEFEVDGKTYKVESVNEAKSITLITYGGKKTKYNNSDINGFISNLNLSSEDLPGFIYKASMGNSNIIGTRAKSYNKKKEAILKLLKKIKSHSGNVVIDVDSKKPSYKQSIKFESVNEAKKTDQWTLDVIDHLEYLKYPKKDIDYIMDFEKKKIKGWKRKKLHPTTVGQQLNIILKKLRRNEAIESKSDCGCGCKGTTPGGCNESLNEEPVAVSMRNDDGSITTTIKEVKDLNEQETALYEFGQKVETLMEKNCPTNPSKWSSYKSQAKQKFDVYPSAYANGWAAKKYKAAGGGWKKC